MPAYLRVVLFLLLFAPVCRAQNWKTINFKDTVYFTAGAYNATLLTSPLLTKDSGYLRVAIVDSVEVTGSDSLFYFIRGIRGIYSSNMWECVDTLAPGWLGRYFTHMDDGTEQYFNLYGDTITLLTEAELNDSWVLAKDHAGTIEFRGTVTQKGTTTIEGVTDSIKTISIQAMQNSIPIASPYNDKVFQISKEHGWIKTLDMFSFPNDTISDSYTRPPIIDKSQHARLPKAFNNYNVNAIDLAWKYAPGNEWIHKTLVTIGSSSTPDMDIVYDSVISSSFIAPDQIKVDLFTETFSKRTGYPITTMSYYHTDTFYVPTTPYIVKGHVMPEYIANLSTIVSPTEYYVTSFCNKFVTTIAPEVLPFMITTNRTHA